MVLKARGISRRPVPFGFWDLCKIGFPGVWFLRCLDGFSSGLVVGFPFQQGI